MFRKYKKNTKILFFEICFEIYVKNLVPVSPEFKFNCPDPLLLHLLYHSLPSRPDK